MGLWGGPKMEGGSQNRGGVSKWGVGAPRSHWRPEILWGFQHHGQRQVMGGGGGGPKMGVGGLKMEGGVSKWGLGV